MKWPLRNCGTTYLRDVIDTVQTVQYSDSQCTLYTVTILARASTLQLVACRALLYSTTTFYTVRVLLFMMMLWFVLLMLFQIFFCVCEDLVLLLLVVLIFQNICE